MKLPRWQYETTREAWIGTHPRMIQRFCEAVGIPAAGCAPPAFIAAFKGRADAEPELLDNVLRATHGELAAEFDAACTAAGIEVEAATSLDALFDPPQPPAP